MSRALSMSQTTDGVTSKVSAHDERVGYVLVFLSAFIWSFGGAIARFIEVDDSWTIVFWRSAWAAVFLVGFMLWRDGLRGMLALFRGMGGAGIAVALCFATASTCFIVALAFTTVANVVLIQAGVPLIAALIAWLVFREQIGLATWGAIAAVIFGVAIMVSGSFGGEVSPIGDGLAVLIAFAFATATVITRRFAHVRMTPATCLGTAIAAVFAVTQAGSLAVSTVDMGLLLTFGALNLGLGLALFTIGARLIPAAFAALIGTAETVFAPIWVALIHSEIPSTRTVVGGAVVLAALLTHIALEFRRQARPAKPGVTGIPAPH